MKLNRIALVAALVLPGLGLAQGIRNSKHDLSFTSTSTVKAATETEVCKFCHSPHRAQSTQLLWNKTQTATAVYNWGNDLDGTPLTATASGTPLPTTLRNASKRCLGCHDGSVSIGDVTNGSAIAITPVANRVDATGRLLAAGGYVTGSAGNLGGSHPVSVPYAGQSGYNGANSGATADNSLGNYYTVVTAGCTSPSGICTSAPTTDSRDGPAINLLPQTPGSTTNVGIECGTCHEPHNRTGQLYFSRVNMNASGLCRSCHNQ